MSCVERYLFERRFDAVPGHDLPMSASDAEPVCTREDVERARAQGLVEGRAETSAEQEARRQFEQRLQGTLDSLAAHIAQLLAATADARAEAGRDAVLIARAISRKLLPARYRDDASAEIEALVAGLLSRVVDEPVVSVRISTSLIGELGPRLEAAAAREGVQTRLRVGGDPSMTEGDCRIEWPGGGVIRDQAALWRDIDTLIEEAIGCSAGVPSTAIAPGDKHD